VPGDQTSPEGVGEQLVVAVPPALVIKRDDEEVLALEGLQHRLAVRTTGDRVAQPGGELVEHRGVEQVCAYLLGLPVEYLLDEVVEDEPLAPRERLDEAGDVFRPVGGAGPGPSG
jgi:hypothetical protein